MNTDQNNHGRLRHKSVCYKLFLTFATAMFLIGWVPILMTMVVGNRVIDDGLDPEDAAIIAEWDAWAFAPRFSIPAIVGLVLLGAHLLLPRLSQRRHTDDSDF